MRLYLIGMPGCGKSSVGKKLALELNYKFYDLDTEIEKDALMFIPEIFDKYGEDTFRILESKMLEKLSLEDNIIIATGGGVIKNKKNKELMDGKVIYITAPLDEIAFRCENDNQNERPLLNTKSVYELYNERCDLYEYFKEVEVLNDNLDKCVKRIKKELKL